MAKLYPSWDVIRCSKPAPTPGELELLRFLTDNLDDSYEVYFQPFLNGDLPDVILMRKGGGVMIFEVKDWNLRNWSVDNKGKWHLAGRQSTYFKSPLDQVLHYKQNLFDLHIEGLLDLKIKDFKYWYAVSCALYFHCSTGEAVKELIYSANSSEKYKTFVTKNFSIFGKDTLQPAILKFVLNEKWISKKSIYFPDELYNSFKRYFQPPLHKIEQGKSINYTATQHELSESIEGGRKRIKGAAGAGKTLVLAQRAVNAHKRTQGKVLILTFNITLRNYIKDKINDVREEFDWSNFHIANYHDFIKAQLNNAGISIQVPDNFNDFTEQEQDLYFEKEFFSNISLFEDIRDQLPKYSAIFIDEAQDYRENWIRIIDRNFLIANGEIVVFADEKQNIYSRDLEVQNKMPVIPIQVGPWDKSLKESFRLCKKIADLASDFQKEFFNKKYEVEQVQIKKQFNLFDEEERNIERIEYRFFPAATADSSISEFIYSRIKTLKIHSNDVCILSSRIKMLRGLEKQLVSTFKEKSTIMFETEDLYQALAAQYNSYDLRRELKKVRKNRKANFWMNRGTLKMSTIHSFKGWEIHTLFLVIENNLNSSDELYKGDFQLNPEIFCDELVYTGITRCRYNLILINVGNNVYHEFFNSNKNIDIKDGWSIDPSTIKKNPPFEIGYEIVAINDAETYVKTKTGEVLLIENIKSAVVSGVIEFQGVFLSKPKHGTYFDDDVTYIRLQAGVKVDTK
jgi:hypothetical protein